MCDVTKIRDYTEKMLFLGTDILTDKDCELMNKQIATSFHRPEGAIYYIKMETGFKSIFKKQGYSQKFNDIVCEARSRGYVWLFFDRDIIFHRYATD